VPWALEEGVLVGGVGWGVELENDWRSDWYG
jgi:hypothetical protein